MPRRASGTADGAFDYYLRINPSAREGMSEVHRCEPYVYAQMIAGKDAPTHGEAKNSWLTGTAAWNFVAITQWILGIRPNMRWAAHRTRSSRRIGRDFCAAASVSRRDAIRYHKCSARGPGNVGGNLEVDGISLLAGKH